uniref:Reverse transcriptase zinc-binding domain-containing protein n=1 Tax=Cannabis sativa TaxID=3483 RepID=A0A803PH81_CANSA
MFNQALLAKQIWRCIRFPNALYSKVLKACHFPDKSVLAAKCGSNASFMWRSLVWGKKIILRGYRWRIGSGNEVRIFEDPWLPRPVTFWVHDKPAFLEQLHVIDLKLTDGSGYRTLVEMRETVAQSDSTQLEAWGRHCGKLRYLQKSSILFGRCHSWLPTNTTLTKRGMNVDPKCSRCTGGCVEDVGHVLWACPLSVEVWKRCGWWDQIRELRTSNTILIFQWLARVWSTDSFDLFLAIGWHLWNVRNTMVHGGYGPRAGDILDWCAKFLSEFQQANGILREKDKGNRGRWTPPVVGVIAINVDASHRMEDKSATIGIVIRGNDRVVQYAAATVLPMTTSPLIA